jgi:hypothetical protein
MSIKNQVHSFVGGEISLWIEQESSIHLKAASSHGDPVELTSEDARKIAVALMAAAQKLDAFDSPKR